MMEGEAEQVPASAHEAVTKLNVVNVRPVHVHAERLAEGGIVEGIDIDVRMAHAVGPGHFANRFDYSVGVLDAEGEQIADLDIAIEVQFVVTDESYVVPDDAAEFIAQTTGLFSAWPYAREALQSLTTRLQLDPVVLGLLPRGATEPLAATRVARSSPDAAE